MADPTVNLPVRQRVEIQERVINEQKELITDLKKSKGNLEDLLKKSQELNENQQKMIIQQQNIMGDQQSAMKDQESILRNQQISIVNQQNEISLQRNRIKELEEKLLRINQEWAEKSQILKNKIFDITEKFNEKEKNIDSVLSEREEKIKGLIQQINKLELEKEKFKTEITRGTVSPIIASEMEEKIKNLERELFTKNKIIKDYEEKFSSGDISLMTEIKIKDMKIAELNRRIAQITGEGPTTGKREKIILTRDSAIQNIKKIIRDLKSAAMIFLPSIKYIDQFNLMNLKPNIRIKLAARIESSYAAKAAKYNSKNNIEIRAYDRGDLWAINKDQEILLLVPIGKDQTHTGLIVDTENQIEFLGSLLNSTWTSKCAKI